jgi:putative transposase
MPQLAPKSLCLELAEREQLQQLLNRHSTPQQLALRARIIVLADEGHNHREIARHLNISRKMARQWRERWLEGQAAGITVLERLQDAERRGAPARFELEQVLQLFKLACDDPADYNRPISQWTNRELADETDAAENRENDFSATCRTIASRSRPQTASVRHLAESPPVTWTPKTGPG